jgi:glycosyltransferase involved in cell wall biosynthesis
MTVAWHILTGEYPPQPGGVGDYTRQTAAALARAGEEVHVWTGGAGEETSETEGVQLHRLHGNFGPVGLARLSGELARSRRSTRLLVQYVPHAFGWKGMNAPFCLWLANRRRESVWVMFHEVAAPIGLELPWKQKILGWVTRWMAARMARSAERLFVSTPAWHPILRELAPDGPEAVWLPVPSNLPTTVSAEEVARIRRRLAPDDGDRLIGHFGTYGELITPLLTAALPLILSRGVARRVLLMGRGASVFAEKLERSTPFCRGRVTAPATQTDAELAAHLAACDVLFQPYPDGVTTRRGSLMAGLALGAPIVTTRGVLTESIWQEQEAVSLTDVDDVAGIAAALETLLNRDDLRRRLSTRAARLYQERFSMDRGVETLLHSLDVAPAAASFSVLPRIQGTRVRSPKVPCPACVNS